MLGVSIPASQLFLARAAPGAGVQPHPRLPALRALREDPSAPARHPPGGESGCLAAVNEPGTARASSRATRGSRSRTASARRWRCAWRSSACSPWSSSARSSSASGRCRSSRASATSRTRTTTRSAASASSRRAARSSTATATCSSPTRPGRSCRSGPPRSRTSPPSQRERMLRRLSRLLGLKVDRRSATEGGGAPGGRPAHPGHDRHDRRRVQDRLSHGAPERVPGRSDHRDVPAKLRAGHPCARRSSAT